MAKQNGPVKLSGSLGNITFARTRHGVIAKQKSSLSGERVSTDPAFAAFRDQQSVFGRAAADVRLIRAAFNDLLLYGKDAMLSQRLQQTLVRIAKTDAQSERPGRRFFHGDLRLMHGFQLNGNADLSGSLRAPYSCSIDREGGTFSVYIPPFLPTEALTAPPGGTHFRISALCSAIDFEQKAQDSVFATSDILSSSEPVSAAVEISGVFTPDPQVPIFLALGLQFIREVNGFQYPEVGGEYNAAAIVLSDF